MSPNDLNNKELGRVLQLIRNGADVNATDGAGCSPLHWAARNGHFDVCKALLENGAKLNTVDNSGWAPLLLAIQRNNINVVRLLLHNGASLEVKDNKHKRPVDRAKENNHLEILDVIEKEFPLSIRLYHAARQGNYDECVALLEQKALHETSHDGLYCPMTAATKKGHTRIVKLLLEKGTKINNEDNDERNSLYLATIKGHKDIVNLLLNKEGNGNIKVNGETLLHVATRKNHEYLVRLFLLNKVNPNVKNNDGYTPLHIAIINGNAFIVNQIVRHSANVNLATNRGETPLHLACEGDHKQIVEILLENGANTDSLNEENHKPMDILNSKFSRIKVDAQVKIKILDNMKALLIPPEADHPTEVAKGATSEGGTEVRRDSSEVKNEHSDEDSDNDVTVQYPSSTFGSIEQDLSGRILDNTEIEELNTKMAEMSALVLELNEKTLNFKIVKSDLALERDSLKLLNRKMDNTRFLKLMKTKDSKYENALEELARAVDGSERKQAELKEEVEKLGSEIPLVKTKFKDVYREITRILNKIELVSICQ